MLRLCLCAFSAPPNVASEQRRSWHGQRHCLGLDHTRLTYRYLGRDFRLTDVGGKVVEKLLA